MIHDKDTELIEKYLAGNLTEYEKQIFDKKIKTNNDFLEEVIFRKNLRVASEQIVTAEFKDRINKIHSANTVNMKKSKKLYFFGALAAAAAAVALLLYFVGNPFFQQNEIDKYLAQAGKINTIFISNISNVNLKSNGENEQQDVDELMVAFITAKKAGKNLNRYFFKDKVLYLFKQSDDLININYKIDNEGVRIYYVCRNQQLFSFKQLEDNKFYHLNLVSGAELPNRCR